MEVPETVWRGSRYLGMKKLDERSADRAEGGFYYVSDEDFNTVKRNHYSQRLVVRFVEGERPFRKHLLWIITKM